MANSLDYMPNLNKIMCEGSTEFTHYYVSTGLCCPSRATILRGQYCHNTKILDNGDLYTFLGGGFNKWTIASYLGSYEIILCGKYLKGYGTLHVLEGWDHWHGMTHMAYFGPCFSNNGKLFKTPKTTYQTDYIQDKTLNKQWDN